MNINFEIEYLLPKMKKKETHLEKRSIYSEARMLIVIVIYSRYNSNYSISKIEQFFYIKPATVCFAQKHYSKFISPTAFFLLTGKEIKILNNYTICNYYNHNIERYYVINDLFNEKQFFWSASHKRGIQKFFVWL